jgi:hypothetical protein
MKTKLLMSLLILSLVLVSGGKAQRLSEIDKPMWTIEYIKAKPGMYGFTLGYLDENWMGVRAEAQRQGAVVSYRRLVQQDESQNEKNIVLITEFKNSNAFIFRNTLFSKILKQMPSPTSDIVKFKPQDLFESSNEIVFLDSQDTSNTQQRLLSKN